MASRNRTDVLQGTLGLLVLKTLAQGPKHGYAIAQHIESVSHELLRVEEGSLYPALHRMEQEGWIAAEWSTTETNRRARFYSLTKTGRKQLDEEQQHWDRLTRGVELILEFGS